MNIVWCKMKISNNAISIHDLTFKRNSFAFKIDLLSINLNEVPKVIKVRKAEIRQVADLRKTDKKKSRTNLEVHTLAIKFKKRHQLIKNILTKVIFSINEIEIISNRGKASLYNIFSENPTIKGELNKLSAISNSKYKFKISILEHNIKISINRLEKDTTDIFSFNKLLAKVDFSDHSKLLVSTFIHLGQLYHPTISRERVEIEYFKAKQFLPLEDTQIFGGDESYIDIDGNVIFYSIVRHNLPNKNINLSIFLQIYSSLSKLIDIIPSPTNPELKTLLDDGNFLAEIDFHINLEDLKNSILSFKFYKNDYNIINIDWDLSYLNNKFPLSTYKHSMLVYSGSTDQSISNFAKKVIIINEDPSFFQHSGIEPMAIGLAIIRNFKSGNTKVGGSTISMQLVKNLFMDESRTLARKLEEAIITVLLENYYSIKKHRILAVYFQVIEFAPGVFGIENGSYFYFGKESNSLTTIQALTLSYIVPRPRFFLDAVLTRSQQLDRNLSNYIENMLENLYFRNLISDIDINSFLTEIEFSENIGKLYLENLKIDRVLKRIQDQKLLQ
ncbi:biosynthetic peptidoglycan transglycosylase [Olivibacter sp. 47]|uniref:biosynthetic peptidoglycan transglycosylase n=1 Tax=Olivibacter sp. 47 TaxID=3056486 RepID=UPI0025A46E5B|nr:biosynthetic peptidoglycan transglycosylase [Olivibacter sp. 47]MDM8173469.1 biosynthetic peptidoglycan transglycosylase [Olivibacter sp. 47]